MTSSTTPLYAVAQPGGAKRRGGGTYSDDFKRKAIAAIRGGKSISQLEREMGVTRRTLSSWMRDAEPPPQTLVEAAKSGDRKAYLEALRDQLAEKIEAGMAARDLPPNVRLLNETMRELEEISAREAEEAGDAASAPDEDLDPDDL